MTEDWDRCSFKFDPVMWGREHDKKCFVDPDFDSDEDILMKNANGNVVWRCPHEAIDGENECMFHLSQDADTKPDAETVADAFLEIVNGKREALDSDSPRPAQFIGAEFESLDIDTERVEDGQVIDLRHSEVGSAEWEVLKFDTERLDARGVSVRRKWDFNVVTFGGDARFGGAEFGGDACFTSVIFGGRVGFDKAEFGGDADFEWAKFRGGTRFINAEFGGHANFIDAEFGEDAWFNAAEFRGDAWFRGTQFGGDTHFNAAEFGRDAGFAEAKFGGRVGFDEAEFGGNAEFAKVEFGGRVGFDEAEFGGNAEFIDAEFGGGARFVGAEFEVGATFTVDGCDPITQFQDDADFSDVTAHGPLRFADGYDSPPGRPYTFLGEVDFSGADVPDAEFSSVFFRESPTFENANLTRADLSDSWFEGAAFVGANLTRANLTETVVARADFNDALLSQASLYGADFTNAGLYGARMGDAHISDHTDFGIRNQPDCNRSILIPSFGPENEVRWGPQPEVRHDPRNPGYDQFTENDGGDTAISDLTRAAAVYAEIERIAEVNADSELASRCYLWRKDMQRKRYWSDEGRGNTRERIQWLRSTLANSFIRYGESPWRVTGVASLIIVGCSLLYYLLDLIEYSTSPSQSALLSTIGETPPNSVITFIDSLYFSTLTFSTLGMGTFQPSGPVGRAVTIFEALSGVILAALLVFVFGRRATR